MHTFITRLHGHYDLRLNRSQLVNIETKSEKESRYLLECCIQVHFAAFWALFSSPHGNVSVIMIVKCLSSAKLNFVVSEASCDGFKKDLTLKMYRSHLVWKYQVRKVTHCH